MLRVFFRTRATHGGRDPHGAPPAGHAPNGAPPSGPPCGRPHDASPSGPPGGREPDGTPPSGLGPPRCPSRRPTPLPAASAPHGTRARSRTWRHLHPAGGGAKLVSDAPARQQQPCSVHRATPPASCGPAGHAAGCCALSSAAWAKVLHAGPHICQVKLE